MTDTMAYLNPRVEGRAPEPWWTPEVLEEYLLDGMLGREHTQCMIHMPHGWQGTMSNGTWQSLSDEYQAVYTQVLGRVKAARPGYQVMIYSGGQFYSAYTNHGRPRPDDGGGFIGEPDWINVKNKQHVRGIRDLTIQPWVDRGIDGWIFDHGSSQPQQIVKWKRLLRNYVKRVGLEAIPWVGNNQAGFVDWSAGNQGVEYYGLTRFRAGLPFLQTVPRRTKAWVWLNHQPIPTVEELTAMIRRGWNVVTNKLYDDLVNEAVRAA